MVFTKGYFGVTNVDYIGMNMYGSKSILTNECIFKERVITLWELSATTTMNCVFRVGFGN